MTNEVCQKKKQFEFSLIIEPKEELTEKQITGLFCQGVEKRPRTNIYCKRSTNFLDMFLAIDSLEHSSGYSGLVELEFTVTKREKN